ncbi:MAG TPA: rod shape-determining protein [Candidatus Dormibacteraeota bacterium]|nr:rod shape-determining protein [Candidatus Dormibacteraeota bacterium]
MPFCSFGIDLGSTTTVVCRPEHGLVLQEPALMLVRAEDHRSEPLLVGADAERLQGRVGNGVTVIRPFREGAVADLPAARAYLTSVLRRITPRPWDRMRPRATLSVPTGATALERRALLEVAEEAGFGRVILFPGPVAGAVGCGLDPMEPRVRLVIDVGGGRSEAVAFCYGDVLTSRSNRIAGEEMTLALRRHLRQQHHLSVDELTAERAKRMATAPNGPVVLEGRDLESGRPRLVTMSAQEVEEVLSPVCTEIAEAMAECLEELPPLAVIDVLQDGVLVLGGGALVPALAEAVTAAFTASARVAERPLTCVAEGAAACTRRPDLRRAYAL